MTSFDIREESWYDYSLCTALVLPPSCSPKISHVASYTLKHLIVYVAPYLEGTFQVDFCISLRTVWSILESLMMLSIYKRNCTNADSFWGAFLGGASFLHHVIQFFSLSKITCFLIFFTFIVSSAISYYSDAALLPQYFVIFTQPNTSVTKKQYFLFPWFVLNKFDSLFFWASFLGVKNHIFLIFSVPYFWQDGQKLCCLEVFPYHDQWLCWLWWCWWYWLQD